MSNYRISRSSVSPVPLECINPFDNKWRLRWDIKEIAVDNLNSELEPPLTEFEYVEYELSYEPTVDDCKNIILEYINKKIDEKILTQFVWKDMSVWLSTENQFNYKSAYDLAVQTSGATLPVIFKFGAIDDPVYYTFNELDDLTDFYTKSVVFVQQTLSEGWEEKDSFNFNPYSL